MTSTSPKPAPRAEPRSPSPWMVLAGLLAVAMLCGGCTTFKPSQLPPDALRSGIRSGALVAAGDEVSVVTVDGTESAIRVTAVDAEVIRGESADQGSVVVSIDEILALRKREIEPVRTTFAALGGSVAALSIILLLDISGTW